LVYSGSADGRINIDGTIRDSVGLLRSCEELRRSGLADEGIRVYGSHLLVLRENSSMVLKGEVVPLGYRISCWITGINGPQFCPSAHIGKGGFPRLMNVLAQIEE
jgi:hypothetical protein